MTDIGHWRPIHESHAIQLGAVSLVFGDPVGDITWRKSIRDVRPLAEEVGFSEQSVVPPGLPPQLAAMGFQIPDQTATSFVLSADDGGLLERLNITREQLRYEDFSYLRWKPFKERARTLLGCAANRYFEVSSLDIIHSEYIDLFVHAGPEGSSKDISKIINQNSKLISKGGFRPDDYWHSHIGWFEHPESRSRYLINVNVDIRDETIGNFEGRVVRIQTSIDVQFGRNGVQRPNDDEMNWDLVDHHLEASHARLKLLLLEIITPAAAKAISLGL